MSVFPAKGEGAGSNPTSERIFFNKFSQMCRPVDEAQGVPTKITSFYSLIAYPILKNYLKF